MGEYLRRALRSIGRGKYRTLFGWWYVSIGAGFLLLAVNRWLIGDTAGLVALRAGIAAGFFILGYLELSSRLRRQ